MPRDKDLKRLVRARMQKTGESYATARAQLVRKAATAKPPRPQPAPAAAVDYAALAGMSEASITANTGCSWQRWVRTLDHHGAEQMTHRDIAALVRESFGIDSWWAQSVTVGYERIKGLRARGQRRDGTYEASKSRTFAVPVADLFAAWTDARKRRKWLPEAVKVRTVSPPKSIRLDWSDGTRLEVGFTDKGAAKSSLAVAHTRLPDAETAARYKQYWTERLVALGALLNPQQ